MMKKYVLILLSFCFIASCYGKGFLKTAWQTIKAHKTLSITTGVGAVMLASQSPVHVAVTASVLGSAVYIGHEVGKRRYNKPVQPVKVVVKRNHYEMLTGVAACVVLGYYCKATIIDVVKHIFNS